MLLAALGALLAALEATLATVSSLLATLGRSTGDFGSSWPLWDRPFESEKASVSIVGLLGHEEQENSKKRHHRLKASAALWICLPSCTLLNLSRFPFHARTGFFGGPDGLFGSLWGPLVGSWLVLWPLGPLLARSWLLLGRSLAALGRPSAALGRS